MIGTSEELEEDLKGFPASDIKGTFTRPFRMEDVIDRMTMELMNVQRLSEAKGKYNYAGKPY